MKNFFIILIIFEFSLLNAQTYEFNKSILIDSKVVDLKNKTFKNLSFMNLSNRNYVLYINADGGIIRDI